jgi:hypothetical protein
VPCIGLTIVALVIGYPSFLSLLISKTNLNVPRKIQCNVIIHTSNMSYSQVYVEHHEQLCGKLFKTILDSPSHKFRGYQNNIKLQPRPRGLLFFIPARFSERTGT